MVFPVAVEKYPRAERIEHINGFVVIFNAKKERREKKTKKKCVGNATTDSPCTTSEVTVTTAVTVIMKVTIVSGRSNPRRDVVEVANNASATDLKKIFKPSLSIHRKSFRFQPEGAAKPIALEDKLLSEYGVKDGSEIVFKDLGPQVGYRTVFVVEYAGPIAFMVLYALRPSWIYGTVSAPLNDTQNLYILMFIAHFIKRELETFFVHKFSRPTMPLMNIFKNSMYYWSFAAFIGYILCHPQYTAPTHGLEKIAASAWGLFELGNLLVHLQLSGMRKVEGETSRNVPKGPLFSLVSCPNYTFEVLGWVAYSLGSNITMSWVFTLVGLLQMTEWAVKKHQGYVKADPANKKKKAIIPFII